MTSPASSANDALVEHVRANLEGLRSRIAAVSDPARVRIVGVTKTFGVDVVRAAVAAGLSDLGENYASELLEKAPATSELAITWHFIGALQSNKIAKVAAHAQVIESVCRDKEFDVLARHSYRGQCYVQLDVTGRDVRNGAPANDIPRLVDYGRSLGLRVEGLMMVAPPGEGAAAAAAFAQAREVADQAELAVRSYGMSDDWELALAAGSTEIRVGRALFGARGSASGLA